MSEYIKHTWQDGEEITDAKLNNIETGIAEAKKEAENSGVAAANAQSKADSAATAAANAQNTANSKAPASHTQSASTVTAGTFAGQVIANASGQNPSVSCLRNSKLSSDESVLPTVEGETVWYYK